MKNLLLTTALLMTTQAFAGIHKCTLTAKLNGGSVIVKTVGYLNSDDNKEIKNGVSLAQLELNARNGQAQPFALATLSSDDSVIVQLKKNVMNVKKVVNKSTGKTEEVRSIIAVDLTEIEDNFASISSEDNYHSVSCSKLK
jgi:hypothetical protein